MREFREMLSSIEGLDLISLMNFPDYKPPEEMSKTFEDNAALKAIHAAKELNKWVLADDSGLVVPSLKGEPGIISRRYAGDEATDAENRKKLLKELEGMEDLQRSAYFHCSIALANPEGLQKAVTGYCEGHIIDSEKGSNGFGYDSLFVRHDYDKTFAELEESTKNRISHRRKAIEKMLSTIEAMISKEQ